MYVLPHVSQLTCVLPECCEYNAPRHSLSLASLLHTYIYNRRRPLNFCWLSNAATCSKKSHFLTFSDSSWRWRANGSLCRHFGDMHACGETSSITAHSLLSGGGVLSISVGFPVQPFAKKSEIFRQYNRKWVSSFNKAR